MKFINSLKSLTKFERGLWGISSAIITLSFLLSPEKDILSLTASLIGAAALIFVAKGHVLGQLLTIVFSVFYGIISYYFDYYGEMITYLGMTAPMALFAVVSWLRHPYKNSEEVEVSRLTPLKVWSLILLTPTVTFVFYFILKALGNASMFFSTLSISTSFAASYLTFLRSPYYALAYAANDMVLIVLWVIAAIKEPYCIPMIFCFVIFLFNDMYGFYNWRKMRKKQLE